MTFIDSEPKSIFLMRCNTRYANKNPKIMAIENCNNKNCGIWILVPFISAIKIIVRVYAIGSFAPDSTSRIDAVLSLRLSLFFFKILNTVVASVEPIVAARSKVYIRSILNIIWNKKPNIIVVKKTPKVARQDAVGITGLEIE